MTKSEAGVRTRQIIKDEIESAKDRLARSITNDINKNVKNDVSSEITAYVTGNSIEELGFYTHCDLEDTIEGTSGDLIRKHREYDELEKLYKELDDMKTEARTKRNVESDIECMMDDLKDFIMDEITVEVDGDTLESLSYSVYDGVDLSAFGGYHELGDLFQELTEIENQEEGGDQ